MSDKIRYLPNFRIQNRTETDDEKQKYVGIMSDQTLDSHSTMMGNSTIRNFAKQAREGVSIFPQHKYYDYSIGKTIRGWSRTDKENTTNKQVWAEFFITKDISDPNTNDLIKLMNNGSMSDLSVGFTRGDYYCQVPGCGLKMKDNWFWMEDNNGHILVQTTKHKNKDLLVTARIENAKLHHLSPVSSGSNENAEIIQELHEKLRERNITDSHILQVICETQGWSYSNIRSQLQDFTKDTKSKIFIPNKGDNIQMSNVQDAGTIERLTGELEERDNTITELETELKQVKIQLEEANEDSLLNDTEIRQDYEKLKAEKETNEVMVKQGEIALEWMREKNLESYIASLGSDIAGPNDPAVEAKRDELKLVKDFTTLARDYRANLQIARKWARSQRKSTSVGIDIDIEQGAAIPEDYGIKIYE